MIKSHLLAKSFKISLWSAFLVFTGTGYSKVITQELETFEQVIESIDEQLEMADPDKTLVIFDLDETIVISDHCPEVSDEGTGLELFEAKINHCKSRFTSSLLPEFLDRLKSNFYVMALTARRKQIISASLRQLKENIHNEDHENYSVVFDTAPEYSKNKVNVPFIQKGPRSETKKELVIKEGVVFASGANKGQALEAYIDFLKPTHNFDNFIFVDDQKVNVRNMGKAFSERSEEMLIIHYTEHQE